jgi:ubiquinone/menaquinone biosynthesis C-methylase UbiE
MFKKKFFDIASDFYDEMLNPNNLISSGEKRISKIIEGEDITTAADLGCGSGNDTIALAMNNIRATGFDNSPQMIKIAKEKALKQGLDVEFVCSALNQIDPEYHDKFDLAISFGNTFSNIKPLQIPDTLEKVNLILKKGKKFYLQVLNYKNFIMKKQVEILNVTKGSDNIFVRFNEVNIRDNTIGFNILKIPVNNPNGYSLIKTKLYPYPASYLKRVLELSGFTNIQVYQDLDRNRFNSNKSRDILIISEKK